MTTGPPAPKGATTVSDQPASLAAAILAVQAELDPIAKGKTAEVPTKSGGKYTYRYASYKAIMAIVFPLLLKYGLVWNSRPTMIDGQFVLAYRLKHLGSDEADEGTYPLPNSTPQTMGGAITYAKRYAIGAVLDLVLTDEDDDAAGAEREVSAPKASGHDSDAKRAEEGRMTRGQLRDHKRLEREVKSSPKQAERHRGPLPDDEWTASDPMTDAQRRTIMGLFGKAGIASSEDRHAYIARNVDDAPAETGNLTKPQASSLIASLMALTESARP